MTGLTSKPSSLLVAISLLSILINFVRLGIKIKLGDFDLGDFGTGDFGVRVSDSRDFELEDYGLGDFDSGEFDM